jgi:hypothetical protein
MQRVLFYDELSREMDGAVDSITSDFSNCFNGKKPNYYDKKIGEKYCYLKTLYNNKQFISREVFNEGLPNIVKVYPNLYNYFYNGIAVDKITADMNSQKEKMQSIINNLYDDLGIPEKEVRPCINGKLSFSINYRSCLQEIIECFKKDERTLIIDSAQYRNTKDFSILKGDIIVLRTCINNYYERCISRFEKNNPNASFEEKTSYMNHKRNLYKWYHLLNSFLDKLDKEGS